MPRMDISDHAVERFIEEPVAGVHDLWSFDDTIGTMALRVAK